MAKGKRMKIKKDKSSTILLLLALILIFGGAAVFFYPNISNYFAEKNQVEVIRKYDEMVVKINEEDLQSEWKKAQIYNENLSGDPVHDPFVEGSGSALPTNYTSVLNITDDGIMAYISIPKISVYLPIYHGTSSETLEKGVGHIQSTSLPVGGQSTHCVLTGHTGLPSAELFTKLDVLEVGDIFYIHVLDKVLTYKIYETKVILPDEIGELQINSKNDYVTLVTCTPYGVNTHRLLVKAERTEYVEYTNSTNTNEVQDSEIVEPENNYYLIGIKIGGLILLILLVFIIILIIIRSHKKHVRKDSTKNE